MGEAAPDLDYSPRQHLRRHSPGKRFGESSCSPGRYALRGALLDPSPARARRPETGGSESTICRLESPRIRKAPRILGRSTHDRRLPFPPASGVSRHVAPAVRMLQMHPTSLSRARVSVRQPSQPATAQLFESCSVRKRALFFAHDGAPRGAWCSGHRLARAEWLRRGSVQLVRPAFRPAPTHSCTRASYAPF